MRTETPKEMKAPTDDISVLLRLAYERERAGQKSEAAALWNALAQVAKAHALVLDDINIATVTEGAGWELPVETPREKQREAWMSLLKPGKVLQCVRHGKVRATCTYKGPEQFLYRGKIYKTISAAANACAVDLEYENTTTNDGKSFWGLVKRKFKTKKKKPLT